MKTKQITAILSIIILFSGISFALTLGNWQGAPAGDANNPVGTGKWTDPYWNNPPAALAIAADAAGYEIKITKANTACVIDSNVGSYKCRLGIAGGTDVSNAAKLEIKDGGYISVEQEVRVGAGGSAASGATGCLFQTGGTLNINGKLIVGRYGTSETNPNDAKGYYTISGGAITTNAAGGLYIAAGGTGGLSDGTFTVVGKSPVIALKTMYVGSDGKKGKGNGTVEFEIASDGVSPIKIADGIYLDLGGEETKANLVVNADATAPKADILLVETESSASVTGIFDTVNGNAAAEGADVVLKAADGSYSYKLTYTGGNGNDIMLKYSKFEPAAAHAAAEPNAAK